MGHGHTVVWCSVHTKHARPSLGILTVCMLRLTAPSEHRDHLQLHLSCDRNSDHQIGAACRAFFL